MTRADSAPLWQYALVAIGFWFVAVPAALLALRAVQVAVTCAVRRHTDRVLTLAQNVVPLPSVAQCERSRT